MCAWDIPSVPNAGDIATVANWAQKVIDSLTAAKAYEDGHPVLFSTYTGNGSGTARQITTGFLCKWVFLHGSYFNDLDANYTIWVINNDVYAIYLRSDSVISYSTNVKLAADGFYVGDANNEANKNAATMRYAAFG